MHSWATYGQLCYSNRYHCARVQVALADARLHQSAEGRQDLPCAMTEMVGPAPAAITAIGREITSVNLTKVLDKLTITIHHLIGKSSTNGWFSLCQISGGYLSESLALNKKLQNLVEVWSWQPGCGNGIDDMMIWYGIVMSCEYPPVN